MINTPMSPQYAAAMARVRTSASWFNAIALFSIINTVIVMTGAKLHFIVGLALTDIITAAGSQFGGTGKGVAFFLNVLVAGIWVLFANQGKKGQRWAFITGMILYLIDGILYVLFQEYISALFHGYVLYRLFAGLQASGDAKAVNIQGAQIGYGGQPAQPAGTWPPPPAGQAPNWPQPGVPAPPPAFGQPSPGQWPPAAPPSGYGQPNPYAPQQPAQPPANQWPPAAPPVGYGQPNPYAPQPPQQPQGEWADPLTQPSAPVGSQPQAQPGGWLASEPETPES